MQGPDTFLLWELSSVLQRAFVRSAAGSAFEARWAGKKANFQIDLPFLNP